MAERIERVIYREVRKGRPVYPLKLRLQAESRQETGRCRAELSTRLAPGRYLGHHTDLQELVGRAKLWVSR